MSPSAVPSSKSLIHSFQTVLKDFLSMRDDAFPRSFFLDRFHCIFHVKNQFATYVNQLEHNANKSISLFSTFDVWRKVLATVRFALRIVGRSEMRHEIVFNAVIVSRILENRSYGNNKNEQQQRSILFSHTTNAYVYRFENNDHCRKFHRFQIQKCLHVIVISATSSWKTKENTFCFSKPMMLHVINDIIMPLKPDVALYGSPNMSSAFTLLRIDIIINIFYNDNAIHTIDFGSSEFLQHRVGERLELRREYANIWDTTLNHTLPSGIL